MGTRIQPDGDKIVAKADTFHLSSQNIFVERIFNRPDSLVLGTFIDNKYGTTYADILARFEAPFDTTGFRYPENAQADSAFLILSYRSWFGAERSSMSVKAYEMNKGKYLDYYTYYQSDLDINEYIDLSSPILLGDTIFAANDSSNVRIRLTKDFTDKLFENSKDFNSEDDFFKKFNGMYITSPLGDATMIYLRGINILLYYHYNTTIAGKDTVFINTTNYVVNNTVVNRFQHPDTTQIKQYLQLHDSINYISSPANIYTQVNIPIKKIIEQMQDSIGVNRKLVVNSALIRVEAKDTDNKTSVSNISIPVPANMLLMKKEEMNNFFTQERLTSDSIVYSSYSSTDSCYTFNIARYITSEIKKASKDENGKILIPDDKQELEMVLVPVRATISTDYYGNSTISSIKQQVLLNGVTIRSGKDPNRPMKINVLYSGF